MAFALNIQSPTRSIESWLWREWTWLLPALIALLVARGSTGPSSYFLHFDTATESHAALDLLNGCWGYAASKPLLMLVMVPVLALGNGDPAWEMIPLAILSALALAALFRLAARLTGSARWAMAARLAPPPTPSRLSLTWLPTGHGPSRTTRFLRQPCGV